MELEKIIYELRQYQAIDCNCNQSLLKQPLSDILIEGNFNELCLGHIAEILDKVSEKVFKGIVQCNPTILGRIRPRINERSKKIVYPTENSPSPEIEISAINNKKLMAERISTLWNISSGDPRNLLGFLEIRKRFFNSELYRTWNSYEFGIKLAERMGLESQLEKMGEENGK